jgi:hypothetical protein
MLVNTTKNTTVVNNGCIKCHNGPKIVCLYCAVKSRFTNIQRRSRYFQTSLRLMSRRWDWGLISKSHCVGVEGVGGVEIVEVVEEVEGVEEAEIVEVVEEVEGVEVVVSGEKSLLNSVFSTSTFMLFLFSCML